MSTLRLASDSVEPVELHFDPLPRTVVQRMRDRVEHVSDERPLLGLQSPVAMDVLSSMSPVVVARRLVRET